MKNPFKDNSLASFLVGIILGTGGCMGYYALTEPEYPTIPQGQIAGIMGNPAADTNAPEQITNDDNNGDNSQAKEPEQNMPSSPEESKENAKIIHTRWYEGEIYHGLQDNPNGEVRVTPAGKKYHRPSCPHIEGHEFISATESDAENAGLTPCKKCKP